MVEGIKDILAELLRTGKDVLECCERMSQVGLCTTNPNIRYCRLFPGCRRRWNYFFGEKLQSITI